MTESERFQQSYQPASRRDAFGCKHHQGKEEQATIARLENNAGGPC